MACETTNESRGEPDKAVGLDQLVEIDAEQFHGNAQMVAEVEVFSHFYNMMLLILVLKSSVSTISAITCVNAHPFAEAIQDLDLYEGLVVEPLLVSDDLDGYRFTSAVVATMQHLSERSLAQCIDDFITVCQVVTIDDKIVTTLIVISMIVRRVIDSGWFFVTVSTNVIDRWVIENLLALIVRKVLSLRAFQNS